VESEGQSAKKAEREKAEREKAEREKAEREKAEREKAEREKAEREKAEHVSPSAFRQLIPYKSQRSIHILFNTASRFPDKLTRRDGTNAAKTQARYGRNTSYVEVCHAFARNRLVKI
jgi:hypothetical protein